MFPSHSTPNRFVPRGSYNYPNSHSPEGYSPRHAQEFYPSRNSPAHNYFSPNASNQFSPRNSTPMGSPVNTPNRNYSSNPNSSFESPQRQFSSPGRPYWNNKRSFNNNQSRNSSEFYSSGNSSFNDSPRGSPYGNRRQSWKAGDNSNKGYNIRKYINPAMLENPWAELEKESKT